MNPIARLYWRFTAHIPRHLPRTEAEYFYFKYVMTYAFDVFDEPSSWAQMSGAIGATRGDRIRTSWGRIANIAKRVRINSLAHSYKQKSIGEMQARLDAGLKAQEAAKESWDLSGIAKDLSPKTGLSLAPESPPQ